MKYEVKLTSKFRKDYKKAIKRGLKIELLDEIITKLANNIPLDSVNQDHELVGDYSGHRECHVTADWLLIYRKFEDVIVLSLTRTGSHSDLF
jgi:mRNA interferase YafQ